MFPPTFLYFFAKFLLSRWFVVRLTVHLFERSLREGISYTLLLYKRAYTHIHITSLTNPSPYSPFDGMEVFLNPPTYKAIPNNLCNTATSSYKTMFQRITVADHLQQTMAICNKTVTDAADGFQCVCNRNTLIFNHLDFRCRCVCNSIWNSPSCYPERCEGWQDKNIDNNDGYGE